MPITNLEPKTDKERLKHFEMTEEIYRLVKKHDQWFRMQKAWVLAKVLIIIAIIVSAWIYLPPLFKQAVEAYQEFDIMKLLPGGASSTLKR